MNYIRSFFVVCLLLLLQSCSVYKAASSEGVSIKNVKKCRERGCFLSLGMDVVDHKLNDDNKYVETYRAKAKKDGTNYLRAVGHGALDIATWGLWEVAGTPIEGAISNNLGYITAIVTYPDSTNCGIIEDIEIYDASGNKLVLKSEK